MADHNLRQPHPSLSIPQYLRPQVSRHHSNTSTSSAKSSQSRKPHPQYTDYIPSNTDVAVEAGVDDVFTERLLQDEAEEAGESGFSQNVDTSPGGSDWDNLRDGSIARRPAWRRPSPAWVYPFLIGMALAIGMTVAPRSELYINLACLSHPPRAPSSVDTQTLYSSMVEREEPQMSGMEAKFVSWSSEQGIGVNTTIPEAEGGEKVDSPGDAWFRKIQHDIYEYERNKRLSHSNSSTGTSSTATHTSQVQPTDPLPHATMTMPGDEDPSATQGPTSPSPTNRPDPSSEDNGRAPYYEIDPKLCKKDPRVQAAAARLTMIMTLTGGLLAAFTTGYWGHTSDRIGRKKLMMVCEMGFLINEICFVLVASYPYLAPGGYRALLIGPTIEGLLGGFSTVSATFHAYISDVTPDGSRATKFARLGGIMMTGFACGPVLGAMIIRASGNILVPFYIAVCIHATFILAIFLLLPESLSTEARQILVKTATLKREAGKRRDAAEREWENETPQNEISNPFLATPRSMGGESTFSRLSADGAGASKRRKKVLGNLRRFGRSFFQFLEPLVIFLPRDREDGTGKDWSLTMVAGAISCLSLMMGILGVKANYTFYQYGWTSAQLGPYMSLVGFARGFVLLAVMPALVYYLKPKFTSDAAPPLDAAVATSGFTQTSSSSSSSAPEPTPAQKTARFDLLIARTCLFIDFFPYIMLATNVNSTTFVILTTVIACGSPSNPAINSLALSLIPNSKEAGRLFGGLSVLHTIGSSLLSPLLFGTLFSATVGWYAPTVFALAAGILGVAQIFLALVRLPGYQSTDKNAERGRSRQVKTVRSSSGIVLRK